MAVLTAAEARARAVAAAGSDEFGPGEFEEGLERVLAGQARAGRLLVCGKVKNPRLAHGSAIDAAYA